MSAVMTGSNTFDWSTVDNAVNQAAARGHQTAMRFYLDYPGRATGIPQFLLQGGLKTYPYTEFDNSTSVIPDYNDANLLSAIDRFIAALGARYDGKAQIGFVQAGLTGFWGEWHTYPYDGTTKPQNYMPTTANQRRVLNAFVSAFKTTELEVRNPDPVNADLPIGYHDDSFALETKPVAAGWHFMNKINDNGLQNKWKTQSIGGELRPELQSCIFSPAGCPVIEPDGDNDFPGSVQQTHISWMMNHYAFQTGYSTADRARALAGAKSLGYSFRATRAYLPTSATAGSSITVGASVQNIGIAPFYYPWAARVALVDSSGNLKANTAVGWKISDVASGASKDFTSSLSLTGVAKGSYRVVLQVPNALSNGAPIRFANAGQDTAKNGWLTLGSLTVN
ncbi:DUF4832 domain-containing protein [Kineosporia sp. NBRC 101677]|uniref:DUF4832 domain-containing protein n=2 Tax=Kineosporia TaxID=49184 RepID=UPI002554E5C0|nr:DUF4832 domain-containing protein [Kineosporia sp. NBRC 101677]